MVVHAIESLVTAGVSDMIVAISPAVDAVRAALGDGTRWGARVSYVTSWPTESIAALVDRVRRQCGSDLLVVRGGVLRSSVITAFLDRVDV